MSPTIYVGIDPGKEGALAMLRDGHMQAVNLPYDGAHMDMPWLQRWVQDHRDGDFVKLLVIEKVNAFGMGKTSAFTFGHGVGKLECLAELMGWPMEMAAPTSWQKRVLRKTTKDKSVALAHVRQRWPSVELPANKKKAEGIADACCLAEYAWQVGRG